jgi:hypothetical protein
MSFAAGAAGIYSDDFSNSGTFPDTATVGWAKINETGGASVTQEGYGTADARAVLSIPSGTAYEMWGSKGGLCVEQSCTDADFTLQAKFDTLPSVNGQEIGIYMRNADNTIGMSCGFFYDSGALNRWAAEYESSREIASAAFTATAPAYVRMQWNTTANETTFKWSDTGAFGGEETTTVDTVSNVAPAFVGIHAASFDSGGIPAFVGKFDYFFETSAVISPEDPVASTSRIMVIT